MTTVIFAYLSNEERQNKPLAMRSHAQWSHFAPSYKVKQKEKITV